MNRIVYNKAVPYFVMSLQDLFEECTSQYNATINKADKNILRLIEESEAEYRGAKIKLDPVEDDIAKDKNDLHEKLKDANTRLRALKNPKGMRGNSAKRSANSNDIGSKRDIIKKEIAMLKLRLQELDRETEYQNKK